MGILDNDLLVIDQVTSFMANDFAVRDRDGQPVGHIQTQGGLLQRALLGNRQLDILETDGSLLMRIDDVVSFGRDRFDLLGSDGQRFGEVVKEFTLFTQRLTVHLASDQLELVGSFWEREFGVTGQYGEVARVSRHWPGIAAAFLSRERYVLAFAPGLSLDVRLGTLGAVVALDLVRQKERNSSSSSSVFGGN